MLLFRIWQLKRTRKAIQEWGTAVVKCQVVQNRSGEEEFQIVFTNFHTVSNHANDITEHSEEVFSTEKCCRHVVTILLANIVFFCMSGGICLPNNKFCHSVARHQMESKCHVLVGESRMFMDVNPTSKMPPSHGGRNRSNLALSLIRHTKGQRTHSSCSCSNHRMVHNSLSKNLQGVKIS